MSAPESTPIDGTTTGMIGPCRAGVVELAALGNRAAAVEAIAAANGLALPPLGRASSSSSGILALGVRPERWLLVAAPAPAGAAAMKWQELCQGTAAVIDQSGGLAALALTGPSAREVLARGCRLDLAVDRFAPGCAAATSMAQVSTILAALPAGILILTPSSTARHLHEWLLAAARPFGLTPQTEVSIATLLGHHDS